MLNLFSTYKNNADVYFTFTRNTKTPVTYQQVEDFLKEFIPYMVSKIGETTANDNTMTLFTFALQGKVLCEYFMEKAAAENIEVFLDSIEDEIYKIAIVGSGSKSQEALKQIDVMLKRVLENPAL